MWRRIIVCALLCVALLSVLQGQDDPTGEFTALYKKALSGLHDARTRDELLKVVDELDAADWHSVVPSGEKLTRAQAVQQLEATLREPPDRRPSLKADLLTVRRGAADAVVVGWIYIEAVRESQRVVSGALFRDTFTKTGKGWRRVFHEKIIDHRPLTVDGKPLVLPPLPVDARLLH